MAASPPRFRRAVYFELKSFFGRRLLSRRPPVVGPGPQLLHLGCGSRIFDGWVNADFFAGRFWAVPKGYWMVDLRYPFPCRDAYWDGVFTEHTLEHLHPLHAEACLREVFRVLKPGCWLRIVVPDLSKYVTFYTSGVGSPRFSEWPGRAEALRALTQDFGHLSLWDSDLLGRSLTAVGFDRVRETWFGEGFDGRLTRDSKAREWESLYMEARRPEPASNPGTRS